MRAPQLGLRVFKVKQTIKIKKIKFKTEKKTGKSSFKLDQQ